MTGPQAHIRQGAQFTQGYFNQVGRIAEDAAKVDQAGHWGVDGWIRLIHNLIDLQIRTGAAVAQAALAGPSWLRATDYDPLLSDEIEVTSENYPRYFTIAKPFERLGHSSIQIPDTAIRFVPDILPAGATTFQIDLLDHNFVGANYVGAIRLRPVGSERGQRQEVEPFSVTVGL